MRNLAITLSRTEQLTVQIRRISTLVAHYAPAAGQLRTPHTTQLFTACTAYHARTNTASQSRKHMPAKTGVFSDVKMKQFSYKRVANERFDWNWGLVTLKALSVGSDRYRQRYRWRLFAECRIEMALSLARGSMRVLAAGNDNLGKGRAVVL